ncbi:hypothetical protein HDR61_05320 [bacterium]|nr:hypothetical protein [Bacteroidales bacterium]MBD5401128.1 hypothetical protein [bacterium]
MDIEKFEIRKGMVYEEVAQTSSYTGSKMTGDENAYERIFTTEDDRSQLERFWRESCTAVCETMRRYLISDYATEEGHVFEFEFSRSFDQALIPSMRQDLFSFFVMNVSAKWFGFCNKGESGEYTQSAAGLLEGFHRKACFKRKPTRPVYNK